MSETRVTPSLDPGTFAAIEGYNEDTSKFVGCVVSAMSYTFQSLQQTHDARELWASNPAVTKENAIMIVGKEAEKRKQNVLQKLDLAGRDLNNNIAHTEALLMEPLTEQAGLGSLNGEVRAYVRGLAPDKRGEFINELLAKDDEGSLTAILGAQHFLSGLMDVERDHYLRRYHEKKCPDLVKRLDLMHRFRDHFERARPIVFAEFQKAVGAHPSVVAQYADADAKAQAALRAEPTA